MEKLLAVVSRAVNYRDHDRILTLITRERGAVTATARGCRKPQSKLLSAVQPFTYGEYVLAPHGDKYYINQCDIRETFYNLRLEPDALQYAAYITALAEEYANPEEPNDRLFSLLLNCLKYLCEGYSHSGVAAFFMAKLMYFAGYSPMVDSCVVCCKTENLEYFSGDEGGAVCSGCARNLSGLQKVEKQTLEMLDALPKIPSAGYGQISNAMQSRESGLFSLMHGYVQYRTNRKLPAITGRYS